MIKMRFSTILILPATIISAAVIPPVSIDPSLIPAFGLVAGQDPNGSGSCAGANNVLIPCFCPPDRQEFVEKVNSAVALGNFLGTPVTFNIDPLAQSNKDRLDHATTSLIVLQSFNGTRGVGCPAASAPTILNQQKQSANLIGRDLSDNRELTEDAFMLGV
ncbi:unnamed protein product [Periconia digitata]|uniref:Uncharacterized protein n=1 Tax=Periconia digitata TaxID=1303443 RepID=A0A9W4UWR1_9PLEO|nr:unnamed protein product [Periconia digitata]